MPRDSDPRSGPPDEEPSRRGGAILPAITLLALLLVIALVWWLFPRLQHYIAYQDCVASFRTNCS